MTEKTGNVILAGDIGGTKTNLALFSNIAGAPKILAQQTLATHSFDSPVTLIEHFINENHIKDISEACFGFAGPVIDGIGNPPNLPWAIDQNSLQKHFKWKTVHLINDLVAMACSIPFLKDNQVAPLNDVPVKSAGNIGLLAAGTGLGEAILFWDGKKYMPSPSEGGHKDFAPRNEIQYRLLCYLHGKYGHASVERVLSGPGLIDIFLFILKDKNIQSPAWLAECRQNIDAAEISQRALAGRDPVCREALMLFSEVYGAEAGNIALQGLTTGGIYVGGGIAPQILSFLKSGPFLRAFYAKGRMRHLLEAMPVRVITDPEAPLWGAAAYAAGKIW